MFNNNTLGKSTKGVIFFDNGSKMTMDNIISASVEVDNSFYKTDATVNLLLGKDIHGELFTLTVPDEKEETEMKTNYFIISCRFMSRDGTYKMSTKLYDYVISAKLKKYCPFMIGIGTEFKVLGSTGKELYDGNRLRIESMMGMESKEDANLFAQKELKEIEYIKVLGEYRPVEHPWFPSFSIRQNKYYYDDKPAEEYWNSCYFYHSRDNDSNEEENSIEKTKESAATGEWLNLLTKKADMEPFIYNWDTINDNKIITKMEEKDMSKNIFGKMFKNLKFGRLDTDEIKYSFNGIAFKTSDGDYVTYNDDFTFTNVADMIIDMPIFAMPVSREQISVGDVIRHNDTWVIVNKVSNTEIKVAKPWTKEIVTVIPETSVFGFSFYTKVMNPFEGFGKDANAENPFGNILPFLMMQNGEGGDSINTLMMAMMLGGGKMDMSNPMMMYMMMSQNKEIDPMMMMLMMGNNPFAPSKETITEKQIDEMIDSGFIKDLYEKISHSLLADANTNENETEGE
ncbi:MAG: hypothetical protein ACI39B_04380 [Methanobrevibacter smithii]